MTAPANPVQAVFDNTNPNWHPSLEYNVFFLRATQNHLNHQLADRGHVFLNEVYDLLGLDRTSEGAISGWLLRPLGGGPQDHIDFGLTEFINSIGDSKTKRLEIESITLRLNIDGIIYQNI